MSVTDPRRAAVAVKIREARVLAARCRSHAAELTAQAEQLEQQADINATWLAGH